MKEINLHSRQIIDAMKRGILKYNMDYLQKIIKNESNRGLKDLIRFFYKEALLELKKDLK